MVYVIPHGSNWICEGEMHEKSGMVEWMAMDDDGDFVYGKHHRSWFARFGLSLSDVLSGPEKDSA